MVATTRRGCAVGSLLVAVACGGTEWDVKSPPETGDVSARTPAQIRLARFLSPDRRHAIVLDRTGPRPKLQVDGSKDIVELSEYEVRKRLELDRYDYYDPDGKLRLSFSKSGDLTYFERGTEIIMNYDRPAPALGRANIAAAAKKAEPGWTVEANELLGRSVVQNVPQLKEADASDLAKVAEAYAKVGPGAFMRYVETNPKGRLPRIDVAPASILGSGFVRNDWKTDDGERNNHRRLAEYGAVVEGYSGGLSSSNHIIAELTEARPNLQNGTPGLIWSVHRNEVTFVGFDGGRYVVDLATDRDQGPKLVAGLGAASSWPKPVQDPFVDYSDLSRLAQVGGAPQATVDSLQQTDMKWNQCAQTAWRPANPKIETGKLTKADEKAFALRVQNACRRYLDQFESLLDAANDRRQATRAALFETAKARAVALDIAE